MKGISRRRFLAASLAGGAATSLTVTKNALGSGTFEGYPEGMGVLVDLTRCVGCRSCEAACNKEQKLPAPAEPFDDMSVYDEPPEDGQKRRTDEKPFTVVNRYEPPGAQPHPLYPQIPVQPLQRAGLPDLLFRQRLHQDQGRGGGLQSQRLRRLPNLHGRLSLLVPAYCYSSAFNPVIKKCILCYDTRLKFGKPPACVEACPQEVMTFGHRKDLIKIGPRADPATTRQVCRSYLRRKGSRRHRLDVPVRRALRADGLRHHPGQRADHLLREGFLGHRADGAGHLARPFHRVPSAGQTEKWAPRRRPSRRKSRRAKNHEQPDSNRD